MAGARVFDAAEPEPAPRALDREVLVDENWSAVGDEGVGDHRAVKGDIVVAEDRITERCGEGGEDFGTTVYRAAAGDEAEGAAGDEVAGEENEIWGEGVDVADNALEEEGFRVFVEVDITDLNDPIAMERSGKIGDGDGPLDDVNLMAGDLAAVKGESSGSGSRADEEVSTGEA